MKWLRPQLRRIKTMLGWQRGTANTLQIEVATQRLRLRSPPTGWKDVLSRVRRRASDNNLSITATGVAFYALIATFPGLLSLFGLYALVFSRAELQRPEGPEGAVLATYASGDPVLSL